MKLGNACPIASRPGLQSTPWRRKAEQMNTLILTERKREQTVSKPIHNIICAPGMLQTNSPSESWKAEGSLSDWSYICSQNHRHGGGGAAMKPLKSIQTWELVESKWPVHLPTVCQGCLTEMAAWKNCACSISSMYLFATSGGFTFHFSMPKRISTSVFLRAKSTFHIHWIYSGLQWTNRAMCVTLWKDSALTFIIAQK